MRNLMINSTEKVNKLQRENSIEAGLSKTIRSLKMPKRKSQKKRRKKRKRKKKRRRSLRKKSLQRIHPKPTTKALPNC